jgi:predicted MarR family transcription regulator
MYGRSASRPTVRQVTAQGVLFSPKVKDINQLMFDDVAAAEEAAATVRGCGVELFLNWAVDCKARAIVRHIFGCDQAVMIHETLDVT